MNLETRKDSVPTHHDSSIPDEIESLESISEHDHNEREQRILQD